MKYTPFICGIAILLSACGGDGSNSSHSGSSSSVHSSSSRQTISLPTDLEDKLFIQTIERITSTLPSGAHREFGDLHVYYGNTAILGDSLLSNAALVAGNYVVAYDAARQKIQVTTQLLGTSLDIIDTYTFITDREGLWLQNYDSGTVIVEGRFNIHDKAFPGFAPLSFIGRKASLTFSKATTSLPPGTYIDSGTAFHLYPTDTSFITDLSNYGLPNGEGTYVYDRPALNIGRDTGFNTTFNAPYQIEYQFTSLTSGTFKENWNSGEILWEGTFVINNIE